MMPKNIKILERRVIPAGEIFIKQGATGSRAYIVESGRVEVFMEAPTGEVVHVAHLGPGALIGEIALYDDGQRSASVKALEATTIISISARDFREAMSKSDSFKNRIKSTMAKRVDEMLGLITKKQETTGAANPETPLLLSKTISALSKLKEKLRQ